MVDRDKVLTVLHKRFPAASPQQIAWAANAIVGLDDEWEDVTRNEPELECHFSVPCDQRCYLADCVRRRKEFRVFEKRDPASAPADPSRHSQGSR